MSSVQLLKSMVKRLDVFWTLGEGVIVSADVQSRTRKNLTHYTRVVLNPFTMKVVEESCSCEAGSFGRKCWHLKLLEQLIENDAGLREEIERARNEMIQAEKDVLSW